MMKLKKITAVLLSVVMLAGMISVPASAQSYKYKVASVPMSDVVDEGKVLRNYTCMALESYDKNYNIYYQYFSMTDWINNSGDVKDVFWDKINVVYTLDEEKYESTYSSELCFKDVDLYQIDISEFRSTGNLKTNKITVDKKLNNVNIYNMNPNKKLTKFAYYSDFNEGIFPVVYDENEHRLKVISDNKWDYDNSNKPQSFTNRKGTVLTCFFEYPGNRITVTTKDGRTKTFSHNCIPNFGQVTTDGTNFYVLDYKTDLKKYYLYKIDDNLTEKKIREYSEDEKSKNFPMVVANYGDTYYIIYDSSDIDKLVAYQLNGKTKTIVKGDTYWNGSNDSFLVYLINDDYLLITTKQQKYKSPNNWSNEMYYVEKYILLNTKTQKKTTIYTHTYTPYSIPTGQYWGIINDNFIYYYSYKDKKICIYNLKKNKVVAKLDSFDQVRDERGGIINRNIWKGNNVYYSSKLKSIKCDDIVGFDDNNIALVLKNGNAYFVDENFNQITESFKAETIDSVKNSNYGDSRCILFTYNDGTQDYFVTYAKEVLTKQETKTTETKTTETTETKTTALSAPKNVSTKTDSTSISLSWDKVSGASAYRVYIKRPDSSKYELYKNVSSTECKVTGLKSGSKYIFKIAALVTKNGKYKEQTLTDAIKAETAKKSSSDSSSNSNNSSIDPKFKAAMDSYEAFFKKYCDFMKKYQKNPSDPTLMKDYFDYLEKYTDTMKKLDEWSGKDLNNAELKYYLEVTSRINKMLADVITG